MPVYKFQLKSTGKTYDMPWDDPDKEPTSLDKKQYAFEQDNKGPLRKAYDWASEPLTDLPSRVGNWAADKIDAPRGPSEEETVPRRSRTGSMYTTNPESAAATRGFTAGAVKGAGDVATSLTSPINAALLLSGVGGEAAAARGLSGTARTLNAVSKGANAAMGLHGAGSAIEGLSKGDYGQAGSGALEALMGAHGLKSGYARALLDDADAVVPPRARPRSTAEPPEMGLQKRTPLPSDNRQGPFYQPGSSFDPNTPIDAEFSVAQPQSQGGIGGAVKQKALPGSKGFFAGRKGVSTNIEDVTDKGINARTPAEAAFNASVPERFKPNPSNTGTTSPYDYVPQGDLGNVGGVGTTEPPPRQTIKPTPIPDAPGPYAKVSDGDVEMLAQSGDAAARQEALKRPSLRGRFSDAGSEVDSASQPQKSTTEAPSTTTSSISNAFNKLKGEGGWIKNPFGQAKKGASPTQTAFEDWVNTRKASKIEGILKQKEFKDLDGLGIDGILDFQAGVRDGRLKDVADYFDDKFAHLTNSGVKLGYRENYLPQMWEEDPDVVKQTYARLGLKPSFTMQRVLQNYSMGIEEGLTPKFKTISDLLGWYEGKANKAIADRKFFDYLKNNDLIRPRGEGGPGWESLDPDHFPTQKFKSKNKTIEITMQAPPDIAQMVNNYLRIPTSELNWRKPGSAMQWMADKASLAKNLSMSSGIPGTAVNAHGFNILARTVIGNPKEAFRAGKYILNPKSAGRFLDEALPTAPWAVRNGLTLTTEGHEMGVSGSTNLAGKAWQGFLKAQGKYFEDPLFQNVIPALKLKHFNDMSADLMKGGLGRVEAAKNAADFTNNLYGGINWDAMGRSRDLGNIARMFVLAPDWLASNIRLGNGMARTLLDPKNPQGRAYAKMARNILGAYMAADVVNNALSDHHMWENAPGHALDIQMGQSDGKDRWLRPFGTAEDFLRLPFDAVSAAVGKGDLGTSSDILKNRMSIPARGAMDIVTKRDRFNRPMLGKDDYGRDIPLSQQVGGVAGEASSMVTPPYVRSMIDYGTGRAGAEESAAGATEMPLRYTHVQKRRNSGRRSRR